MGGFTRNPVTGLPDFIGRYQKHGFKYLGAKGVVVPASATKPAYFVIGGNIYQATADLECNLLSSGAGGLATGLSLAANTVYYLYAVVTTNSLRLIADTNDPDTGPREFDVWTYLGAFISNRSTATVDCFQSCLGRCYLDQKRAAVSHTGDTAVTAKTIVMPTTTKAAVGFFQIDGAPGSAEFAGHVRGFNQTDSSHFFQYQSVNGIAITSGEMVVPLETYNTIYLNVETAALTIQWFGTGWIEDPSEWA